LTDSTQRGLPDIEILSPSNRLHGIREIFDVCSLPLIFDGDTGGKPEQFAIHIKMLERAGVSAVVIEDKCGLKKNSLFGNAVSQEQDSIEEFCEKIRVGCASRSHRDLMIIARCESLILDRGMEDAIERCLAYVEAGADGIMIHSRKKDGLEILAVIYANHMLRSAYLAMREVANGILALITTLLHATAVGGRSGGRILLRTSAVLTAFLTLP
jgi:phosphoenolpyruvate phosphomutase